MGNQIEVVCVVLVLWNILTIAISLNEMMGLVGRIEWG